MRLPAAQAGAGTGGRGQSQQLVRLRRQRRQRLLDARNHRAVRHRARESRREQQCRHDRDESVPRRLRVGERLIDLRAAQFDRAIQRAGQRDRALPDILAQQIAERFAVALAENQHRLVERPFGPQYQHVDFGGQRAFVVGIARQCPLIRGPCRGRARARLLQREAGGFESAQIFDGAVERVGRFLRIGARDILQAEDRRQSVAVEIRQRVAAALDRGQTGADRQTRA